MELELIIIIALIVIVFVISIIFIRYIRIITSDDPTQKFFSFREKNKLELIYNRGEITTLEIRSYHRGKFEKKHEIEITQDQIQDEKILNVEKIIEEVQNEFGKKQVVNLIIGSDKVFTVVNSLPKVKKSKAKKINTQAMKDNYGNYKEQYMVKEKTYSYPLGVVIQEYFIPKEIIFNFLQLAKAVGGKITKIQLLGEYLGQKLIKDKKGDCAFIYQRGDKVTSGILYQDKLVGLQSYNAKTAEEVAKKFILGIGKHEYEFEKKEIQDLYVDGEMDLARYFPKQTIHTDPIEGDSSCKKDSH